MNHWRVRLAHQAARDVEDILDWTLEQFGPLQLEIYTDAINNALEALTEGPANVGVRCPPELGENMATLHVARQGRKGRHLFIFRVDHSENLIEVLRVLHDSMDFARHLDS